MKQFSKNMFEDIEAVIFDLDGTVADSMWVWVDVDAAYIEKYNLQVPENFYKDMEGKSYTEVAQYYLDVFPSLEGTVEDIKKEWDDMVLDVYKEKVSLKSGMHVFLEALKEKQIKIGIASSNNKAIINEFLSAKNILHYFKTVRTSCEVKKGKPSPDVYLLAAKDLAVDPEKCLVFEDVPNGILAGKRAGMRVCAIQDDYSDNQILRKKELADFYINDYFDIINETYEVLE